MRTRNKPRGACKCTQPTFHRWAKGALSGRARNHQNTGNAADLIARALAVLDVQIRSSGPLTSPDAVRDYLRLSLANLEHEVFAVILLDAQNRVMAYEELFRGTLTETCVHAREVVKTVLQRNAASVIFAHNHPSSDSIPSEFDELMTRRLKDALALIDVEVLDHFLIAGPDLVSFRERGLL